MTHQTLSLEKYRKLFPATLIHFCHRHFPLMTSSASSWLTVLPIRDMNFDFNKSEFRDAVKLRYDWLVPDMPPVCVCG